MHSAYYLHEEDFKRLYDTFGAVEIAAVLHRPDVAANLPRHKPEFTFIPATELPNSSWVERARYAVRAKLYGESTVAMVPLASAGTVYVHDGLTWVSSGGRHSSPLSRAVDQVTRGSFSGILAYLLTSLLTLFACAGSLHALISYALLFHRTTSHRTWVTQQLGCLEWVQHFPLGGMTYGAAHSFLYWYTAPKLPSPAFGLALVWLALGGFILGVLLRWAVWPATSPGFFTDMTVTVSHGTVIADGQLEPIADVFKLRVGEPRKLPKVVFGDCYIEPLAFNMAYAIFSSTNVEANPVQAEGRARAAIMRRYGFNLTSTVESTKAALAAFRRHGRIAQGNEIIANIRGAPGKKAPSIWSPFAWAWTLIRIPWLCIRELVSFIRSNWPVMLLSVLATAPLWLPGVEPDL